MKQGLVHIYTGNGKGKTSCALGLALRARGAGLKVALYQFLKNPECKSSERKIAKSLGIELTCFNQIHPMFRSCLPAGTANLKPQSEASPQGETSNLFVAIEKSLIIVKKELSKYDVVILDEIINLVSEKFLDETVLINLIKDKPKTPELVLTGRGASAKLKKLADYVTELKEIKHPYKKGVKARKGIEY